MRFGEVMEYYDYKVCNIMKALKVARESVNSWKNNDHIPFRMQCIIQVMTKGELLIDEEYLK